MPGAPDPLYVAARRTLSPASLPDLAQDLIASLRD
jgi:hypothetical protein